MGRPNQINISVNDDTLALIEELKMVFGLASSAAVLRRALAIARLAANNRRDDNTISIIGKDEVQRDILLNA